MTFKRVFLLILDSLGVGETTDALNYNSVGANTLKHINENKIANLLMERQWSTWPVVMLPTLRQPPCS